MTTTSLYVNNLPASATAATLTGMFARYGTVLSVTIAQSRHGPFNYGFVEMQTLEEARNAVSGLNEKTLDGCVVSVSRAARV